MHVAMVVDGEPVVGAVGAPGLGLTSSTKQVPDLPDRADRRRIVVTGRTRVQVDGFVVANALDAELVACSSAGFKAMLVMGGHADVYVHDGPLYEWDVCAPVAVALAAGLDAVTTRGERIVFNQRRPVVDGVLISRPELTESVLAALR